MPLSGNVVLAPRFEGVFTGSTTGLTQRISIKDGQNSIPDGSVTFTEGSGVNQANKWHYSYRTLSATTGENLDLAGSLSDVLGATLTLSAVKSIVAIIDYGSGSYDGTKTLQFSAGSSNGMTTLPLSGTSPVLTFDRQLMLFVGTAAGWAVTAGSADTIRFYNPGASSVSYALWIQGH